MSAGLRRDDDEEESIYDLIPKQAVVRQKGVRYVSTYNKQVVEEVKKRKDTVGPGTYGPVPQHLRKSEVVRGKVDTARIEEDSGTKPNQSPNTRRIHEVIRPPVPKHNERPEIKPPTNTNYITHNAVNNIGSVPKKPVPKFVDTPSGNAAPLDSSGLVPKYMKKKEYGKLPKYISKRRQFEQEDNEKKRLEFEETEKANDPLQELSEEDRHSVLTGLKKNWEELYHQYQGLSLVTDTLPKKTRKEALEAQLSQLERDIEMLEKPEKIYITRDGGING